MYEMQRGTERITAALSAAKGNKRALRVLSEILYYEPEQLQQDVQALEDFIRAHSSN